MSRRWGLVLLVVLLAGCSRAAPREVIHWPYPASIDSVVPPPVQQAIRKAERVEFALVESREKEGGERVGPPGGSSWRLRTAWELATPSEADSLRRLVLENTNYMTEHKLCIFDPAFAIQWISGTDTTGALVCLKCSELQGWRHEVKFGGQVDPARTRWKSWALAAFPDDSMHGDPERQYRVEGREVDAR